MSIQLSTLMALKEYADRLSHELYLRADVRARLLERALISARVLGQNVDPRDHARAVQIIEEIEAR